MNNNNVDQKSNLILEVSKIKSQIERKLMILPILQKELDMLKNEFNNLKEKINLI
jgi:hypothetical protein